MDGVFDESQHGGGVRPRRRRGVDVEGRLRPSRGICLLASVVAIVGLATLSEYLSTAKRNGSIGVRVIEALSGQLDATHEWSGPGTVFMLTTGPTGQGDPS